VLTVRFLKGYARFWQCDEIGAIVCTGIVIVLLVNVPIIPAVPALFVSADLLFAASRRFAKGVAHQRVERRKRTDEKRQHREYLAANERQAKLDRLKPQPEPPPTRIQLAGIANRVFKDDEAIAHLIEDELIREIAVQAANLKYVKRLDEIMRQG
jgi:hypothetical protein